MKCKKTIVVLGCPRSGTSMIAGMLRHLGIYMGERIKADKHEDIDILWQPVDKVIKVIHKRNKERTVWGWKDPNCAKYIDHVLPIIVNPQFIYIVRNEQDAIESELRRNRTTNRPGVKRRNTTFTLTYDRIAQQYPTLTIQYEQAIQQPEQCAIQMAHHIDEGITITQIGKAAQFIQPGGYRTLLEPTHATS